MFNNRSVKLLTIYIALCVPLCNIFVKKEKYHEFQFCGAVTNFLHNIVFKLQEYYITISLNTAHLNVIYISSPKFRIWQHLEDHWNGTQLPSLGQYTNSIH